MKIKKLKAKKVRADAMPEESIAIALRVCHGLQYLAAEKLGLSGASVSLRISRSPYLQEVREECQQRRIDEAELAMFKLIKEDNFNAACFTLKTLGKSRGYSESVPVYVSPEIAQAFAHHMDQLKAYQAERKIEDKTSIKE